MSKRTRKPAVTENQQEPVVETAEASLPPAADSVADAQREPDTPALDADQEPFDTPEPVAAAEPAPEPEPETLCAETGPEGPVGDDTPQPKKDPRWVGGYMTENGPVDPGMAYDPPGPEGPVGEPEPEPDPAQETAAQLDAMAQNRMLRLQIKAMEKTLERQKAEVAIDTSEGVIPKRTFIFARGLGGQVVLSPGTQRYDPKQNMLVTDRPAIYAQFNGGLWSTTSKYEAMLMERHPAFINGKVKDYGEIKINRRKSLEAQLASLDEHGNAIGPAPSFAGATIGGGAAPGTGGFQEAACAHGDFTLPPLHDNSVPILPRGAVTSKR
jgi:hypothetical protein